jgi:hypothetical protein
MSYFCVAYLQMTLVAHMTQRPVIGLWIILKYAKESSRSLEVLSQHFLAGTEQKHKNFDQGSQSLGRDWRKIS